MQTGGSIHPVTGRPMEEEEAVPRTEKQLSEQSRLEAAASFVPVAESEAARKLADLIETVLYHRIQELAMADDQCLAMLKIMEAFDTRRDFARRAVKQLMNRKP